MDVKIKKYTGYWEISNDLETSTDIRLRTVGVLSKHGVESKHIQKDVSTI